MLIYIRDLWGGGLGAGWGGAAEAGRASSQLSIVDLGAGGHGPLRNDARSHWAAVVEDLSSVARRSCHLGSDILRS